MADIRQNSGIRDIFNRVENPLSFGGKWAIVDSAFNSEADDGTRAYTPGVAGAYGWSYWTQNVYDGDDAEAWACVYASAGPTLAWDLLLVKDVGGSGAADGYIFRYGRTTGGGYSELYRITNNAPTLLAGDIFDHSGGDPSMTLIRRNGGDVEGWYSYDAGANWTMQVSASDSTYTTGLYGGIANFGATSGWTCFGSGPLDDWNQEFIRRPHNYMGRYVDRQ